MIPTFKVNICFLAAVLLLIACNEKEKPAKVKKLSFQSFKGIRYFEVKRRFSNGLSFDTTGFQLEPSWILEFKSNDSVSTWSPTMYKWVNFPVLFDHDRVYNFAHEFFRIKTLSKDSLTMQRLEVNSNIVVQGFRSDVNMTFYSKDYIFNKLHTTPEFLQKPSHKDSLFIRQLAETSNLEPGNRKLAFDARQPVQFISLSNSAKGERIDRKVKINGSYSISSTYMSPEYKIEIKNAYKNFNHLFSAIVDARGNFHIIKTYNVLEGDADARKRLIKGIADVYLKNLFKVIPGSTLGIPHSSEIMIYAKGIAKK